MLRLCVHAINGIYSRYAGPLRSRAADPEFYPLVDKLRKIQEAGEIGMHLQKTDDREATIVLFKRRVNPALEADVAEVRKILGLDPEAQEFNVVYGTVATNNREIALLTRPMMEILIDLSSYIEVPAASLAEGRTFSSPAPEVVNGKPVMPLIRILSFSPKDRRISSPRFLIAKPGTGLTIRTSLPSGFFPLSCSCSRSSKARPNKAGRSSRSLPVEEANGPTR